MIAQYYTLLIRDDRLSPWSIEFGAYERGEVDYELESMSPQYARSDMHIVTTPVTVNGSIQADIEFAVHCLNKHLIENASVEIDGAWIRVWADV